MQTVIKAATKRSMINALIILSRLFSFGGIDLRTNTKRISINPAIGIRTIFISA